MAKEKYTLIAYHCRNCGGTVDPDKELCDWCSQQVQFKRYLGEVLKRHQVRVLLDCGKDFVYLDEITSISSYEPPHDIEVTSFGDTSRRYIKGLDADNSIDVEIPITQRGKELLSKIKSGKEYQTRFEFLTMDRAFEVRTFPIVRMPDISNFPYEVLKTTISFEIDSDMKSFDTVVPENCTCPNCGAPIKSKYGCCDYCGGWIEWKF